MLTSTEPSSSVGRLMMNLCTVSNSPPATGVHGVAPHTKVVEHLD